MAEQKRFNFCGDCCSCFTAHRCASEPALFVRDVQLEQKRFTVHSDRLMPMLADIGGLDFPRLSTEPLPALPPFIPQLTNPWFRNQPPLDYPVVAIGINRVFARTGRINSELLQVGNVQRWLHVPPNTHVMLIGCAKDHLIETTWENSRDFASFERLAQLGFSSMTGINFSVYFEEPRMEHLVNLKRSALSCVEAAKAGLMAIPHIHWGHEIDLERMAEWLCDQHSVQAVAFNMQTYRTRALWRRALEGILYFNTLMNRPLTFILIGVSLYDRVRQLDSLPKLCLVSARPFMLAQHHTCIDSGAELIRSRNISPAQLFHKNLDIVLGRLEKRLLPRA